MQSGNMQSDSDRTEERIDMLPGGPRVSERRPVEIFFY